MCGIAGYSLRSRSDLERTLAAQALLAAIAERGADAVGYAYRAPDETYATVVKQRTPASQLAPNSPLPQGSLLSQVRVSPPVPTQGLQIRNSVVPLQVCVPVPQQVRVVEAVGQVECRESAHVAGTRSAAQ